MGIYLVIGGLALVSGFLSGLVGIGGGIVMAPLLLYVPPYFGVAALSMKTVAGLTIVQGLVACLSGAWAHGRYHFVSSPLTLYMGTSIFIAAGVGGAASGFVSDQVLLSVFAGLAFTAACIMFLPLKEDPEYPQARDILFKPYRAVTAASGVGFLGGLVGQGGSFILIPLMRAYVRVPTRIAIGSNLAIVTLSSAAAFIGKAATGQIAWRLAIPILITVVPAAALGSRLSRKTSIRILRVILAFLIAAAALRIWIGVFTGIS